MLRVARYCLYGLGLFVGVLLVNTLLFTSKQLPIEPYTPLAIDEEGPVERLRQAIGYRTISHQIPWEFKGSEFEAFHAFLEGAYPLVHARLQREIVSRYSLLYTWAGSDPERAPIILLAHIDVVPVDGASAQDWTHPPFDGTVADGYIWGRGAVDDKSSLIAILESVERLLEDGFVPARTIYLAFGHDEEIGGRNGAGAIANLLEERGVRAYFSLDEGSGVTDGILPAIDVPVAVVSLAEKGYVSVELLARGKGGHSSQPPQETSIGMIGRAIQRLEENQMPAHLDGPILDLFDYAGREMAFPMRAVMANLWLTSGLVKAQLASSPTTAAAIRTTTAPTIMSAGTKENVLPIEARAVVNFRVHPMDSIESVLEHVRRVVDDERIQIRAMGKMTNDPEDAPEPVLATGDAALEDEHDITPPSPVSDIESESYALLNRTIRQVFQVPVAPGMSLGGTDSKHYYGVAENLYRFQPMIFTDEDLATIHGTDERIAIDNYLRAIRFYVQFFKNLT